MAFTVGELILGSLLLALAAAWARWRALPLGPSLHPTPGGLAVGLVASLPACALLLVLAGPRARCSHPDLLERSLRHSRVNSSSPQWWTLGCDLNHISRRRGLLAEAHSTLSEKHDRSPNGA